jgi:hypothetical protein
VGTTGWILPWRGRVSRGVRKFLSEEFLSEEFKLSLHKTDSLS